VQAQWQDCENGSADLPLRPTAAAVRRGLAGALWRRLLRHSNLDGHFWFDFLIERINPNHIRSLFLQNLGAPCEIKIKSIILEAPVTSRVRSNGDACPACLLLLYPPPLPSRLLMLSSVRGQGYIQFCILTCDPNWMLERCLKTRTILFLNVQTQLDHSCLQ
jgi:hypothetical protein